MLLDKGLDRVAVIQVLREVGDRNPRSPKDRLPAELSEGDLDGIV